MRDEEAGPPAAATTDERQSTVSAVVVNWNGGSQLLACLGALREQSHAFDELIVVDNASTDGSVERARELHPEVRILRNDKNLGFGAGVNRGVEQAGSKWIALVNNDAILDPNWLVEMLATAASEERLGMVACKIYLDRETRTLDKIGHRIAMDGQNFGRGHGQQDRGQYEALRKVAWPDGCAGLWRRSVFAQVGGLDEEFFAYADDADLGIRFRLAGWHCAFSPGAIVEHHHSQTLGAYSARKLYLVERNRIWLAAKYFPYSLLLLNIPLWTLRATGTLLAARRGHGPWANVPNPGKIHVIAAIFRAQLAGWWGLCHQLRKRRDLTDRCGRHWPDRMRALLEEASVSLAELARGDVS